MKHNLIISAFFILLCTITQAQNNCNTKEMAHIIDSIQKAKSITYCSIRTNSIDPTFQTTSTSREPFFIQYPFLVFNNTTYYNLKTLLMFNIVEDTSRNFIYFEFRFDILVR